MPARLRVDAGSQLEAAVGTTGSRRLREALPHRAAAARERKIQLRKSFPAIAKIR